jgi:long-subunit acyl-CoA synthetase (AMP-forming)
MSQLLAPYAAQKAPDAALVDDRGNVTWLELDDRVNRLIKGLRRRGLRSGDPVAVLLGNRNEFFSTRCRDRRLASSRSRCCATPSGSEQDAASDDRGRRVDEPSQSGWTPALCRTASSR